MTALKCTVEDISLMSDFRLDCWSSKGRVRELEYAKQICKHEVLLLISNLRVSLLKVLSIVNGYANARCLVRILDDLDKVVVGEFGDVALESSKLRLSP
jgi:hypothetical protein